MQDNSQTPSETDPETDATAANAAPDAAENSPAPVSPEASTAESTTPQSATPAADLPTLEDLDAVAEEVQRVETALPLLDKKNSPMCQPCQAAFADATAEERLALLQCGHEVPGAA